MNGIAAALTSALVLALGACVVSQEPLVSAEEAERDPRLPGAWEEVGGAATAVVAEAEGGVYRIEHTEGDVQEHLVARLGRLGDHRILDLQGVPAPEEATRPGSGDPVPAHLLVVLTLTGPDEARLAVLEPDSVAAAIRDGSLGLTASERDGDLVLHGGTAALRAALAPFLDRPGVLAEAEVWRRSEPTMK